MTRLTLPPPIAAAPPGQRRAAPWLCAVMALWAMAAPAAVTQGGGADAGPPPLGVGTRTLDKALGGDLTTGDRNLDLLLDSQRRAGERLEAAPTSRPLPDRPLPDRPLAGRQVLQPLPQAATASAVALPVAPNAPRRYEPSLALPEGGQLGSASPPTPKAARDWSGSSTSQAAAGSGGSGGSIYGDTSRLRSAIRPLREWIQQSVAFVKDHVIAILLVGAAIALLAKGLKAYSRRI